MTDLVVALSEATVQRIFREVIDNFSFDDPNIQHTWDWGYVTGHVKFHLANGDVDLLPDGQVHVSELDIVWEILQFDFHVVIPPQCVGGWCVSTPPPWPDICFPSVCVFGVDLWAPLYLPADGIHSEVSGTFSFPVFHPPNVWQLVLDPTGPIDVDVFDFADSMEDLFKNSVKDALAPFLNVPDWVLDLLWDLIGEPVDWVLGSILEVGDDLQEWLENLLGIDIGLENVLAKWVLSLMDPIVVYEIKEPYELLPADGQNPPVKVRFTDLFLQTTDDEAILGVNLKQP